MFNGGIDAKPEEIIDLKKLVIMKTVNADGDIEMKDLSKMKDEGEEESDSFIEYR